MHVNEALFFEYMSRCYRHVMHVCYFAEDVRLCLKKKKKKVLRVLSQKNR